jgi:hypothetical protein
MLRDRRPAATCGSRQRGTHFFVIRAIIGPRARAVKKKSLGPSAPTLDTMVGFPYLCLRFLRAGIAPQQISSLKEFACRIF